MEFDYLHLNRAYKDALDNFRHNLISKIGEQDPQFDEFFQMGQSMLFEKLKAQEQELKAQEQELKDKTLQLFIGELKEKGLRGELEIDVEHVKVILDFAEHLESEKNTPLADKSKSLLHVLANMSLRGKSFGPPKRKKGKPPTKGKLREDSKSWAFSEKYCCEAAAAEFNTGVSNIKRRRAAVKREMKKQGVTDERASLLVDIFIREHEKDKRRKELGPQISDLYTKRKKLKPSSEDFIAIQAQIDNLFDEIESAGK